MISSAVGAAWSSKDTDEADAEVEFVDCARERDSIRSFEAEGVSNLQVEYL